MVKAVQVTPSSKVEFLGLRGDFTEIVRVTFSPGSRLSGWYVFERDSDGRNKFVRKPEKSELIEIVSCPTDDLVFDPKLGALPHERYKNYKTLAPDQPEYNPMKARLAAVEEWR